MKTFVGIDLGSTTTKAVLLDEDRKVVGHGITNSRSNYATAARVASQEARVDGQFTLFRRALTEAHAQVAEGRELQVGAVCDEVEKPMTDDEELQDPGTLPVLCY